MENNLNITSQTHHRLAWRIVQTPAMGGGDNMARDIETMSDVAQNGAAPTLRFFQFSQPTLSFGRLQNADTVRKFVPAGWASVQRPTAGGIVYHDKDLCFSLCWRPGTTSLPHSTDAIYTWIHRHVLDSLDADGGFYLKPCEKDVPEPRRQDQRRCFTEAVAHDILREGKKVVGGAMAFKKNAALYQGSIQLSADPHQLIKRLHSVLVRALRD